MGALQELDKFVPVKEAEEELPPDTTETGTDAKDAGEKGTTEKDKEGSAADPENEVADRINITFANFIPDVQKSIISMLMGSINATQDDATAKNEIEQKLKSSKALFTFEKDKLKAIIGLNK